MGFGSDVDATTSRAAGQSRISCEREGWTGGASECFYIRQPACGLPPRLRKTAQAAGELSAEGCQPRGRVAALRRALRESPSSILRGFDARVGIAELVSAGRDGGDGARHVRLDSVKRGEGELGHGNHTRPEVGNGYGTC